MELARYMRRNGAVLRRRDLLDAGFSDAAIRGALGGHQIFRVRQGWYALPDTSDLATRVIRVGGRLTGLAALRTLGMYLPKPRLIDIVVPKGAAGLRRPNNKRERLDARDGIRVHWIDSSPARRVPSDWRVSDDDALLCVLKHETRTVAVACCDALVRYRGWGRARLSTVFARAPIRTHGWLHLVDGRADAWGETAVRLMLGDAGIPFEAQARVPGVRGRFDGQVSRNVYVEIDGRQHDEDWDGETASSFERDHEKDVALAIARGRSIRITYSQLESAWPECLAAIRQAIADDRA